MDESMENKTSNVSTTCYIENCKNKMFRRGLCSRHCRSPCQAPGCKERSINKGYCRKHGEPKLCSNCQVNPVRRNGLCKSCGSHPCIHKNCTTSARSSSDFCTKHGSRCLHIDVDGVVCTSGTKDASNYCRKHSIPNKNN